MLLPFFLVSVCELGLLFFFFFWLSHIRFEVTHLTPTFNQTFFDVWWLHFLSRQTSGLRRLQLASFMEAVLLFHILESLSCVHGCWG